MFDTGHYRHVPVERDDVRHRVHGFVERNLAVLRFDDIEAEFFQDPPGDHSDDFGSVHDEEGFHVRGPVSDVFPADPQSAFSRPTLSSKF